MRQHAFYRKNGREMNRGINFSGKWAACRSYRVELSRYRANRYRKIPLT
jgi:hypothetical protein